jgi:hypothetical protein
VLEIDRDLSVTDVQPIVTRTCSCPPPWISFCLSADDRWQKRWPLAETYPPDWLPLPTARWEWTRTGVRARSRGFPIALVSGLLRLFSQLDSDECAFQPVRWVSVAFLLLWMWWKWVEGCLLCVLHGMPYSSCLPQTGANWFGDWVSRQGRRNQALLVRVVFTLSISLVWSCYQWLTVFWLWLRHGSFSCLSAGVPALFAPVWCMVPLHVCGTRERHSSNVCGGCWSLAFTFFCHDVEIDSYLAAWALLPSWRVLFPGVFMQGEKFWCGISSTRQFLAGMRYWGINYGIVMLLMYWWYS